MAEKRMISKVISISKKFNIELNDHFSRLLYVLLIPHSDDFGRLTGDPFKIKALILPMMEEVKFSDVEEALKKLHNAELIIWYESSGEMFIQIINFDSHQQGLHKRTRSKFPEPPGHSEKFPEIPPERKGREGNRTEENRTEEKGTEGSLPAPPSESVKDHLLNLVKACNIKNYTLYELDVLYSYIGVVDNEVIETAIKKATNKDHINYAINTLNGMIKEGKTKKEHIIAKIPKAGNRQGQLKTGKPILEVVKDDSPPQKMNDEEREKLRELARQLKDGA